VPGEENSSLIDLFLEFFILQNPLQAMELTEHLRRNNITMGYNKVGKSNTARVVIADDHYLFRQILSLTLEKVGIEVVGEAATGMQAVEAILKHKPDIVLMDVIMPEMDGLAALSILKYMCPEIPVFIITALDDPLYMARAGELGAEGFFSKTVTSEELVSAIHAVVSGESFRIEARHNPQVPVPSIPVATLPKAVPQNPAWEELTEQERLILSLIATGLDNQTLVNKLHISKNTLKTHMRNIFSKLGVSDRTKAAIWAIQNGYSAKVPA